MLRKLREHEDEGFTLIELLVVVIIIGILAAIAIPVFLNQREKARNAAANSDMRNLITAEEAYFTDNDAYTATVADLSSDGFTESSGVLHCVVVDGTSASYEAVTNHPDGSLFYAYDSEDGIIGKGDTAAAAATDAGGFEEATSPCAPA